MTEEKAQGSDQVLHGISLSSFLQLLEQERKSCSVVVHQDKKTGRLYFKDGAMIDAEYYDLFGLEAAYNILSWEKSKFRLYQEEERIVRISKSLTHVLLTVSAQRDEHKALEKKHTFQKKKKSTASSLVERLIAKLIEIPGVKHYFILSSQGRIIAQSTKNQNFGNFIAYCLLSGAQVQEAVEGKELHNIRIGLPDDNLLLIIPRKNYTISLILNQGTSLGEVFTYLREILTSKKK
ncbi:DUF4388 domain-containing protein [Desulforhopalus sp. 52FAK]